MAGRVKKMLKAIKVYAINLFKTLFFILFAPYKFPI